MNNRIELRRVLRQKVTVKRICVRRAIDECRKYEHTFQLLVYNVLGARLWTLFWDIYHINCSNGLASFAWRIRKPLIHFDVLAFESYSYTTCLMRWRILIFTLCFMPFHIDIDFEYISHRTLNTLQVAAGIKAPPPPHLSTHLLFSARAYRNVRNKTSSHVYQRVLLAPKHDWVTQQFSCVWY